VKRFPRAEILLPLTILAGAVLLGISEFMVTFELTPPGAEALDELTAADRHSYALLILAAFAVGSTMMAVGTGLRPFAFAAAGFGVAALLIFLIVDLPDAGKLGTVNDITYATAELDPQSGFVFEAIGSVVLGLATVAFATLSSEQLQAPLRRSRKKRDSREEREPAPRKAKPKPKSRAKSKENGGPPDRKPRRSSRAARNYEPFDYESKGSPKEPKGE
jgi:hypothetical protein